MPQTLGAPSFRSFIAEGWETTNLNQQSQETGMLSGRATSKRREQGPSIQVTLQAAESSWNVFQKSALCQGTTSVVPKKARKQWGFNP
jgi:hypothetical protein